jgi:energy-coupling factor transporter ATP-binding protein EcfA2
MALLRVTSVKFLNYKAFSNFSITLQEFNVLVGPNNSGKSTIVGAFRILSQGIRRARARSPERVEADGISTMGYKLSIDSIPVAAENIFHNYDDSRGAKVTFKLSNGNQLALHFPEQGVCILVAEPKSGEIRTTKQFKEKFDVEIGFVPILGPVEQNEPLYGKEAARLALLASGASRNFRNIWYHYPEGFEIFRNLIMSTWPGMDIQPPELSVDMRQIHMFCPEERVLREICWSGYGFQVWCQMLTFLVKASTSSLIVIDEPDIYLHSDLQRQLVALLTNLGPDIVLATHSTEIIAECEPMSLLSINKRKNSASRVKDVSQLKRVFVSLGSNLNPTLTQLAKTRRAIFVEGLDFQIISPIARALGMQNLANRANFAVIQTEGFNPRRAVDLASGIEKTIGSKILRAVVLDRDYRSDEEIVAIEKELLSYGFLVHIHPRKEIENYLLNTSILDSAVKVRLKEKERRSENYVEIQPPDVAKLLNKAMDDTRHDVFAQRLARYTDFKKKTESSLDAATVNLQFSRAFEDSWGQIGGREMIVPGKDVLAKINRELQAGWNISLSDGLIANQFTKNNLADDFLTLLETLKRFSEVSPPD